MKRVATWLGLGAVAVLAPWMAWDLRGDLLFHASCAGWTRTARVLLAVGVDANGNTNAGSGEYPVFAAASCGQTDVLEALLAAGGNPNTGCCEETAIGEAARHGHAAAVRVLLAAGADPHDGGGLVHAARVGDRESVALLLQAGVAATDDVIASAREFGHEDIARMLETSREPTGR